MTTFNSSQVAQNGDSNEAEDQMQEKDYTENFFKEVEVEINVNDDAAEGQIQNQASDIEQLQQINQPESKGVTKKNLKETLQEVAEEVIESEESPRKKLEEVLEKVVEREENSEKSVEEVAEEKVDSNLVICEFSNNDGNNEDAPIDSNQIVIQEVLDSQDNNVNLSAQESSEAIH
jgi:DNA-binding transcriptional MerR regulator